MKLNSKRSETESGTRPRGICDQKIRVSAPTLAIYETNSKHRKTESGTQPRGIRDQNDPSNGSKLEPFMKLNSKRCETESGMQPRSIRGQNDPSIGSKLSSDQKKFRGCLPRQLGSFRLLPGFVPVATFYCCGKREALIETILFCVLNLDFLSHL